MDREEIKLLLKNMGVVRNQIFVSLSHEDKDIAIPLLKMMDERRLNYWCMYTSTGGARNQASENYKDIIAKKIDACCLFVFMYSEKSIVSAEVHAELRQVAAAIQNKEHIRVFPVALDRGKYTVPESIKKMNILGEGTVFCDLEDKTSASLEHLMTDIRTQYYDILLENIDISYNLMVESRRFTDLLSSCIGKRCYARTVSQDIKASEEGNSSSLLEAHIMTDELKEYDYHPYSCMLISSNLLGKFDDNAGMFKPAEKGVKYFYYCPEDYLNEIKAAYKNKLRSYIVRDRDSRSEVVCLIRREFVERNKIDSYFGRFNLSTIQDLINKYNITSSEDIQRFREAMQLDENYVFFSYTDTEEQRLQVPHEFMVWLSGDHRKINWHVLKEAYSFVDFLKRLVGYIEDVRTESPARNELVKNFKKHCRFLDQLVLLEKWQMGALEQKLSNVEAKKLCNHLIDFTMGSDGSKTRELPNLSNWMRFYYDNDGSDFKLPDNIVDQALKNVTFIPLKKNCKITPCYSFVLYLNKDSTSASWYSTGYEDDTKDLVIAYDANSETNEYLEYQKAFLALIENDKEIKEILKTNNSIILQRGENIF